MAGKPPSIPRDFFYGNIFKSDKVANAMKCAVWDNLFPFKELLDNLLKNNDRLTKISADVEEVKTAITLDPEFVLVRVDSGAESKYAIPPGHHYLLEWKDEYDGFSSINDRNGPVLTTGNMLDLYNGFAIFKSDSEIKGRLSIYYDDDEGVDVVQLHPIDFMEDYREGKYRIRSDPLIKTVSFDGNHLCCPTNSEEIFLFNKVKLKKVNGKIDNSSSIRFNNGSKHLQLKPDTFAVFDDVVKSAHRNNAPIGFETLKHSDYPEAIGDGNIAFKGGRLRLVNGGGDSAGGYESSNGLSYACKFEKYKESPKFRNEGTFVRLIDNDSYNSDVFTSSSFFFREEIEELTDVVRGKGGERGREFKIGMKNEDENIIEIVEKKGEKYVRVKDIPEKLYLVSNPFQLRMQMKAVNTLIYEPAPHHKNLINLTRDRQWQNWDQIDTSECRIDEWHVLNKDSYDGVEDQRKMVIRTLCTRDFSFLEGPPGSGKTTTILEIIAQMIMRGERVMLAASTHAAIDNILERLEILPEKVKSRLLVARVGNEYSVSETVEKYRPEKIPDEALRDIVHRNANLVCGTTFGILKHPEFNLNGKKQYEITPKLFDCLIVDEASKTTFQDFLVPALYAKKWVLSGDIKQLTPYVDKEDIAGSIRHMNGFNESQQEILGLVHQLTIDLHGGLNGFRFAIPIDQSNINLISKFMPESAAYVCVADSPDCIRPGDIINGTNASIKMYGADYIFFDKSLYSIISKYLPSANIVILKEERDVLESRFRNEYYYQSRKKSQGKLTIDGTYCSAIPEIADRMTATVRKRDWAGEIAWRMARIQELFMVGASEDVYGSKTKKQEEIDERIPAIYSKEINNVLCPLRELAIPSILQLLKQGMSEDLIRNKDHRTTLNSGFSEGDYDSRSILLKYQGRMHPDISEFSRSNFYNGAALIDNSVVKNNRKWSCTIFKSRSCWLNVTSDTARKNENIHEIRRIFDLIEEFSNFSMNNKKKSDPGDDGVWTIAILTYYGRQERRIKEEMSRKYKHANPNGNPNQRTYTFGDKNLRVEVYSVDKYQGKEADVVVISMVKSGSAPLGFMDSPNRLNVVLTRAKYQRVIVGDKRYFTSCKSSILKKLAEGSSI